MANFKAKDLTTSVTINLTCKITSGGHSDVYKGKLALPADGSSTCVAVKQPRYALTHLTNKIIKDVKNEIDLWSKLDHPNVLPLLGTYRLNDADVLPGAVSPWCDDGTLIEYLKSARDGRTKLTHGPMRDGSFALLCLEVELLSQATSGLEYLHAQNIIHGDVKGCNILVQDGVARLCDFGYSVLVGERLGMTSSHLGTSRWFAPESLQSGARRTREADIWALGCVVLEVCTLKVPFRDLNDLAVHTALHRGNLPYTYPCDMNMKLWRIAEECWSLHASRRPTSQVISTRLKDLLSPLRTLADTFVLSSGLLLSEFTAAAVLSAVARLPQEAGSDSRLGLKRVRDVIDALEYLGGRYHPTQAVVRSSARAIAMSDPALAEQLMTKFSSPQLRSPLRRHAAMNSVAFLPDGRRLVSSSYYTSLRIFDIETGKTVMGPLTGHSNVCCVAVHGSHIASCSDVGTFDVINADSGELVLGPISAHDGKWSNWIAYSKDGTHIATAGQDHRAVLWDASTGVQVCEMLGHTGPVRCVAFSEDGTRLVSGSQDGTVRIWDVSSGQCIGKPLTGHKSRVTAVCFGRNGRHIFSSSADRTVRIWDADGTVRVLVTETRAPTAEHKRKDHQVFPMALSPDGNRLVAGSPTGRIAMWDTETGVLIPTSFKSHDEQVLALAFSPDGRKIASASEDETIALWDATDEWKRYDIKDDDAEQNDTLCTESQW